MTDRSDTVNDALRFIDADVVVDVDRPKGSRHPAYGFVYPLNYGFVPGTMSGDGEPIDAYVLGPDEPLSRFEGRCVAVVVREEEDDPKLVVVRPGDDPTDDEILEQVEFQEQFFSSSIVRGRAPTAS